MGRVQGVISFGLRGTLTLPAWLVYIDAVVVIMVAIVTVLLDKVIVVVMIKMDEGMVSMCTVVVVVVVKTVCGAAGAADYSGGDGHRWSGGNVGAGYSTCWC